MKSEKLLNKSGAAFLLFVLLIMLAVSCRKDFEDTIPGVTPESEPGNWIVPYVFPDEPAIISEDEPFAANVIKELGEGLSFGEVLEGGLEVGKTIFEIYEYEHTEARFDSIDNQLITISNQIIDLDAKMDQLGSKLAISIEELNNNDLNQPILDAIIIIKTAYGGGGTANLQFFSSTAKAYQEHPGITANITAMENLKLIIPDYITSVDDGGSKDALLQFTKIHDHLCTNHLVESSLYEYARLLIQETDGQIVDSTSVMNTYLVLESYFLRVVNYQFQAATIYLNVKNFQDSTGGYEERFWTQTLRPYITEEIEYFLQMVDYLTVNMADYRNEQRFVNDMPFANAGLAPDRNNVYARSQFVANMLYSALGITPPVISGRILIPHRYTTDGSTSSPSLNISVGMSSIVATPTNYKGNPYITSMIPYTYWQDITCHPDHNWVVYRFSADTTKVWQGGTPQDIQLLDAPWPSTETIKGSVTPLYYNPRNPSQTSKVKTDSCTFQFGYFSANWQWGRLYQANPAHLLPYWFDISYYNKLIKSSTGDGGANLPVANNTTKSNLFGKYIIGDRNKPPSLDIKLSYTYNNSTTFNANGSRPGNKAKHDYYFIIADYKISSVITGSDKPPNGISSIEAWGSYDMLVNTSMSTELSKIIVSMGTNCTAPKAYASILQGDILELTHNLDDQNLSYSSFLGISGLETNAEYLNSGFGYYFEEHYDRGKSSTLPINIAIKYNLQFIYTGKYPASN